MSNGGRLLEILCILLNDNAFKNSAAECLVQIVNRKGKPEERKPLLILFNDDAARCILAAVQTERLNFDEQHYLFLKKLVQVSNYFKIQIELFFESISGNFFELFNI